MLRSVGGHTDVEHLSRRDVDEEQDIEAVEGGGVDGEEVASDSGLRVQEL